MPPEESSSPGGTPVDTQVDRTVLSWARTSATLGVVALLFGRWAADVGPVAFLPAVFGLLAAIMIWVLTRSQAGARRARFASGRSDTPLRTAAGLCTVTVVLADTALLALFMD